MTTACFWCTRHTTWLAVVACSLLWWHGTTVLPDSCHEVRFAVVAPRLAEHYCMQTVRHLCTQTQPTRSLTSFCPSVSPACCERCIRLSVLSATTLLATQSVCCVWRRRRMPFPQLCGNDALCGQLSRVSRSAEAPATGRGCSNPLWIPACAMLAGFDLALGTAVRRNAGTLCVIPVP